MRAILETRCGFSLNVRAREAPAQLRSRTRGTLKSHSRCVYTFANAGGGAKKNNSYACVYVAIERDEKRRVCVSVATTDPRIDAAAG